MDLSLSYCQDKRLGSTLAELKVKAGCLLNREVIKLCSNVNTATRVGLENVVEAGKVETRSDNQRRQTSLEEKAKG